jgi:hypothetical protein
MTIKSADISIIFLGVMYFAHWDRSVGVPLFELFDSNDATESDWDCFRTYMERKHTLEDLTGESTHITNKTYVQ